MAGRKIGSLWKGKEGSNAVLNGTIELLGEPLRISVFKHEKKPEGKDKQPDYDIVRYLDDVEQQPTQTEDVPF